MTRGAERERDGKSQKEVEEGREKQNTGVPALRGFGERMKRMRKRHIAQDRGMWQQG